MPSWTFASFVGDCFYKTINHKGHEGSRRKSSFPRHLRCDLYSQTESLIFATYDMPLSPSRKSAFVFIAAKVLFMHSIDFFFQNFSNRAKKNNQLDTALSSQYFLTH